MAANRILLAVIPTTIMIVAAIVMPGIEHWLAAFGKTAQVKLMLGRILALPYVMAAAIGVIFLFAANGAANIKAAGWSAVAGSIATILIAVAREIVRLASIAGSVPLGQSVLAYADPATMIGASVAFFAGSGGFKTTSVTIPTALKWGGGLVVLDPSSEVAPMVLDHRRKAGRNVIVLDPARLNHDLHGGRLERQPVPRIS